MDDDLEQQIAARLAPERIRDNLITASIFIAAFEFLKLAVIEPIRSLHLVNIENGKKVYSDDYMQAIGSRQHQYRPSLDWLVSRGIIDQSEAEILDEIRCHRNEIAHELPLFALSWDKEVKVELLVEAKRLLTKIDRVWVMWEVDANPDFDNQEVEPEDVASGRMVFFDIILDAVSDR